MEINEILEGNKLIASFMGDISSIDSNVSFNKSCSVNELKYHSSWDWLIPCVDKIYDMDEYSEYKQTLSIFNGGVEINTKFIISTFKDVLVFIEWYNLNNK